MTRACLLVIGLVFLAGTSGAHSEQVARWRVVCDQDDTTVASHCYLSFLGRDKAKGNWLGIAVQRLNGSHEIQVTSNGEPYSRAEINVQSDTTIVTDYCYDSYCVFVQANELVEQFRKGIRADVWLYNRRNKASVKQRVSLRGFTRAHEEYLRRIGE